MKSDQQKQLVELINASPTLKPERKETILKALEHLDEAQAEKLIKIFLDARDRYEQVERDHSGATAEVKKKYLEKANEFTRTELTDLFHTWEEAENVKEEKELEKLEKEIEKVPEE